MSHVKSFAINQTHVGFSHNSHAVWGCLRSGCRRLASLLLGSRLGQQRSSHAEPSPRFVSRLREDDVLAAVQRVLARPLLASERAAFDAGWRPQGLLTADDSYTFRAASPNYEGCAAIVYLFALAADGYGRADEKQLSLVEVALVTLENPGVYTPLEFLD